MKVFISSVRRGLEQERDSLPALLTAVGHEPLRFEDFTAQPIPSRDTCLRCVQAADVYLLLIGSQYGEPIPETGLSPTHEEFNAAALRGIPRLAFRKAGVELEAAQTQFVREVEKYSTGLFRDSFFNAVDLQAKVLAALAALPEASQPLVWSPLASPIVVEWRDGWAAPPQLPASHAAEVELHAAPIDPIRLSARQLRDHATLLAHRLRELNIIPTAIALDSGSDTTAAWALPQLGVGAPTRETVRPEALLGLRLSASGQRSVWQRLPADMMGSVLDAEDLPDRFTRLLRLIGGMAPLPDGDWAFGVALTPSIAFSLAPLTSLGKRNSAQGLSVDPSPVRVEPDESVGSAALGAGAGDVASVLAQNLLAAFSRRV